MTAIGSACGSCGAELRAGDKVCHECAAPVDAAANPAEYKQVTVLFADVVHSMDVAATVGAERLREIMADLADRCAAVVQHFGGTVDKFTGDGIMAVFGAPVALEDHAVRACLAALGVQPNGRRSGVSFATLDMFAGIERCKWAGQTLELQARLRLLARTANGVYTGQRPVCAVNPKITFAISYDAEHRGVRAK